MAQRSSVVPATPSDTPPDGGAYREPRQRIVARFLVAVGASAVADVLWWLHEPRQLSKPISVVGNPAFANFDYIPSFLAYRLVIYAFPVGALLVYCLLAWRGPLRRPKAARRRRRTEQLQDMPAADADLATDQASRTGSGPTLSLLVRLLLPAIVVELAATAGTINPGIGLSDLGLACFIGYLIAVFVVAAGLSWVRTRPRAPQWPHVMSELPAVNGIGGAVVAIAGLWFVSRHTVVVVGSGQRVQHWPWLPGWVALAGIIVIAAWGLLRLRGGRAAAAVEQRLLAVVVGSAAVFLISSRLPSQLGGFIGFDDAQNLVGAHLLSEGQFPFRDFMIFHGLWTDSLQSLIGFAVFGSTRWGSVASISVLLVPLVWIGLYLFAVWFCRSNRWFLACVVVLVLTGLLNMQTDVGHDLGVLPDTRFFAAPLILVLLGETLRRRSLGWCTALMIVTFVEAVLIPETMFLALPVLLVVVAADLTHRPAGSRVWPALRRSTWCAAVGVVLVAAWCGFLAANHALTGWIQYFALVVPAHEAEGAIPPTGDPALVLGSFALCILLVVLTFWSVVARVRGGRQLSARDWVAAAAAGFVALYGEEALGRFDAGHIDLVVIGAMPLILLWAERALTVADDLVLHTFSSGQSLVRNPATMAAAVIVALIAPITGAPTVFASVRSIPAREHALAATEPKIPGLGYIAPAANPAVLVSNLATALNIYAGRSGTVFDMTNSPGYIYLLLNRRPASRFTNIGQAMTAYSQQLIIGDLERSRPPVAVFESDMIGMWEWDDINNNVRDYAVSQYLLDHYQPVLLTDGELLLLRDDLMASRPPVPRLLQQPVSANLYFSGATCAWGDVPNFLPTAPAGRSMLLRVTARVRTGDVTTSVVTLPAGLSLARYDLLTLRADGPIGTSGVTISDTAAAPASHDITATALPASGSSLSVRVGSCLQWHGYSSTRLYVRQVGGTPVSGLELSGVAG